MIIDLYNTGFCFTSTSLTFSNVEDLTKAEMRIFLFHAGNNTSNRSKAKSDGSKAINSDRRMSGAKDYAETRKAVIL